MLLHKSRKANQSERQILALVRQPSARTKQYVSDQMKVTSSYADVEDGSRYVQVTAMYR